MTWAWGARREVLYVPHISTPLLVCRLEQFFPAILWWDKPLVQDSRIPTWVLRGIAGNSSCFSAFLRLFPKSSTATLVSLHEVLWLRQNDQAKAGFSSCDLKLDKINLAETTPQRVCHTTLQTQTNMICSVVQSISVLFALLKLMMLF